MAEKNETTTKFKVDISELVSGMQSAKRQIALANAEFKSATSGMNNWAKSADGVGSKLTQLDTTLSGQKTILSGLEQQYQLTVTQMGANSKEAENLKIKIENQKASIANTEKQIGTYKQALTDIGTESTKSESSLGKLTKTISDQETDLSDLKTAYSNAVIEFGKGSKEAKDLAGQIDTLSTDLSNNKKAIDNADKAADSFDKSLDNLDDSARKAGDGFSVFKGAVATFAGNMAVKAVGSIKDGLGSIVNLADETKEFRQDMGTLNTAFSNVGLSADQAKGTWKKLYSVFGEDDRAVEASNNIARMSKDQKDLDKWVKITTGVWGTYQDALPVEGLAESAGETAKVGKVTGNLADALNWSSDAATMFSDYMGGDVVTAEDAFNKALGECNTEGDRQKLITKTLTKLYGGASEKYKETADSVMKSNDATADLTLAQAEMGEKIEPVITSVKQGFAKLLLKLLDVAKGMDLSAVIKKIGDGFSYLSGTVMPAVISGVGWIKDNIKLLIPVVATLVTTLALMKIVSFVSGIQKMIGVIKGWHLITKTMAIAQAALNLVMSANPIGLIITAIGLLVAAFVVLWNNSEAFRNFFINLWDNICSVVSAAVSAIGGFFTGLWDGIKAGLSAIVEFYKAAIGVVIGLIKGYIDLTIKIYSTIGKWVYDHVIKPVADFVTGLWGSITSGAKTAWSTISGVFKVVSTWFNDNLIKPVGGFFTGLWNGLKTGASTAWEGVKLVFSTVATFFGNIFSTAWEKVKAVFSVGGKIFDGIKDGIVSAFSTVVNAIIKGINKLIKIPFGFINGALNLIHDISFLGVSPFKGLWDKNPITIPQIPELYQGGVLRKGQVGLLEGNGDEAVVPLEHNTAWLDKVADRIVAKGGLSGHGNSQTVYNNYNYEYNQTNNSPKPLSRLEIYRQTKNQFNYATGGVI